jgi:dihydropteroate synthase
VATTAYLLPLAFANSPQAEEGDAVCVAGGLTYASRFAVIKREGARVVSHQRFSAAALQAALPVLPDEIATQFADLKAPRAPLVLPTRDGTRTIRLDQPQVAGILNMTPDSFSDGGEFLDNPDVAHAHAMAMLEAGAALVDIGGESTRPGAPGVWEGDELKRVVPAVERLARAGAAISVDTRRVAVMEAALAAGAQVINDVSALRHDPRALEFAVRSDVPVILMHAPGDGQNLHAEAGYANVVLDVFDWLRDRRDAALAAGIPRENIVLDPGIGFGKSLADNLALLNALSLFHSLGQPLMLGGSRKRTIGALSNEAPAHKRLGGSLMLAVQGMQAGVQLLRVHDVAETVQALRVWRGLRDAALTDFGMVSG